MTNKINQVEQPIECQLPNHDALFAAFIADSVDGTLLLKDGFIISSNHSVQTLLQYSQDQSLNGLTLLDISVEHQSNNVSAQAMLDSIKADNVTNASYKFDWCFQRTDQTVLWSEITATRIGQKSDDLLLLVVRDISEQMELEKEIHNRNQALEASNVGLNFLLDNLAETQEQLVQSEKMASLAILVAGVAHEINTPVGISLTGITQLLKESTLIQKRYESGNLTENSFEEFITIANELSEMVKSSLDRISHLVSSFKKIDISQSADTEQTINLRNHIEEALFCLENALQTSKITCELICPDDYEVVVKPELISQIITNLTVNSIQHGFSDNQHGRITISVTKASPGIFIFQYQDNGVGIDPEQSEKIFSPFFTTNRKDGHMGLGLSIVYNIVTQGLDGLIEYNGNKTEGARFTIKMKLEEAE